MPENGEPTFEEEETMSIVTFIRARLREDDQAPEGDARTPTMAAYWGDLFIEEGRYHDAYGNDITEELLRWQESLPLAPSAVRWNDEVEAKAVLLADRLTTLGYEEGQEGRWLERDTVLRALAHPYRFHPDYRPEWRLP